MVFFRPDDFFFAASLALGRQGAAKALAGAVPMVNGLHSGSNGRMQHLVAN